ncbi:MAG: hypothetical protein HYV09_35850 [Deltaproteobacteria bacterium]|nr:hypothetical protein [Deltaproteobacteria bacterium]
MPRPPSDSVQITVRVPPSWLADADEIAAAMSSPGLTVTRTDAFRAAIARGLDVLRTEHAATAKKPAKK